MLYEYGDIDRLTEELLAILHDDALRERLRANAIEFARSLTWEKTAEAAVGLLEKVVRDWNGGTTD
jgi:glycosyltransferase involved in cell wall biosynthesis